MCVHLASCSVCGVLEDGGEVEAAEVSALRARGGAYGAGAAALSAIASVVCVEECTDSCARTVVHRKAAGGSAAASHGATTSRA